MNNLKGFTFFKSYYECLQDLDEKTQNEILKSILEYMFEDKKPKLKGIKKTIWTLIEPHLNTSKNRSNDKSGAPLSNKNACKTGENEQSEETIKKQSKNNQKTTSDLLFFSYSNSYSLSNSISYSNSNIINNNILNNLFIEYLKLRDNKEYIINDLVVDELINKLEQAENDEDREQMLKNAIKGGWKDFYLIEKTKEKKIQNLGNGAFKI